VSYTFIIDARPQESAEKTTLDFAQGIPRFDSKRRPLKAESSASSDALLWPVLVIGACAIMFAVFTIVSV
jgi:hypothetical protein